MKRTARKNMGFTLIEMLVVIAIIAVLAATAIAVIGAQLENARESTDAANIRAQYAQVMALAAETNADVNADGAQFAKIDLVQTQSDWQSEKLKDTMENVLFPGRIVGGQPAASGSAWVKYVAAENAAYLCFGAGGDVPHGVNWSQCSSIGGKARALLPGGINQRVIYGTASDLTTDEQEMLTLIKEQLNLDDNITVHFGWNPYPKIKVTVLNKSLNAEDYASSGSYAQREYATRITYNPDTKEIEKVEEQWGGWGNNNGSVGFWSNSEGGKYPTNVVYEKGSTR